MVGSKSLPREVFDQIVAKTEAAANLFDPRQDFSFGGGFREAKTRAIADFEKRYLSQLMAEAAGNITLAARLAGKERRALGKLLKKYDLDK